MTKDYAVRFLNPIITDEKASFPLNRKVLLYREDERFKQALEIMKSVSFADSGHSLGHAFRVATWSMVFYSHIFPDGEDYIDYFLMGFLHDAGRSDGGPDTSHGRASVRIIEEKNIPLGPEFKKAIETHPFPKEAQSTEETCLFDADRLDLVRFGRSLDLSRFSKAIRRNIEDFERINGLFVRNKFCSFVPCQLRNKGAIEFLMYLDENFEYLKSRYLYHGSHLHDIKTLEGKRHREDFPLRGDFVYATKDFYEAFFIVYARKAIPQVSIYLCKNENISKTFYSVRGIEYGLASGISPDREIVINIPEDAPVFDYYAHLTENDVIRRLGLDS